MISQQAFQDDFRNVLRAEQQLARQDGVRIIDVRPGLCGAGYCHYIRNDHSVFADHGHITENFSLGLSDIFKLALTQ